jgi:hypothetical protein
VYTVAFQGGESSKSPPYKGGFTERAREFPNAL